MGKRASLDAAVRGTVEVISENNYLDTMKTRVAPFLESLRHSVLLNREGTQKLYCEYYLQPSELKKGSIFISHGFTESCGKYHEVIYYFLKAGYNVCMIEHRNHGRSRCAGETDIAHTATHVENFQFYIYDMAYAVEKALKRKLPAPYYLFSHSMGGAVAASYLEQYPGTFSKAVFSAPMLEINRGGMPLAVAKGIAAFHCLTGRGREFSLGQTPFLREPNFVCSGAASEPRYLYYFEQQLATPEFQSGGSSYRWVIESFHADERLLKPANCARVKTPVLLFQAENDDFVSPGGQDQFIDRIPNGRLIFVPGAKHEIFSSTDDILEKYWYAIFRFLS